MELFSTRFQDGFFRGSELAIETTDREPAAVGTHAPLYESFGLLRDPKDLCLGKTL